MKFIPKGWQPTLDISGWQFSVFEVVGAEQSMTKEIKNQFREEICSKGTLHVFKVDETTFILHVNPEGGMEE